MGLAFFLELAATLKSQLAEPFVPHPRHELASQIEALSFVGSRQKRKGDLEIIGISGVSSWSRRLTASTAADVTFREKERYSKKKGRICMKIARILSLFVIDGFCAVAPVLQDRSSEWSSSALA